jgi:hypoxanthine-guanine phosphoribosyltransferase
LKTETPLEVIVGFGIKYIHVWRSLAMVQVGGNDDVEEKNNIFLQ